MINADALVDEHFHNLRATHQRTNHVVSSVIRKLAHEKLLHEFE